MELAEDEDDPLHCELCSCKIVQLCNYATVHICM